MKTILFRLLPLLIILLFSLWGMKALFHPGFFTSHDGWHIVARLYHYDVATRDIQIPPRWIGNLLFGFGYPLYIFSYHLPWIMAEPLILTGISVFDSIKIIFFITYFLSGILMFVLLNELTKSSLASLLGALLYLFTPYRFATVLVRANMGEAVSFAFVPLIFLGILRLSRKITFNNIIVTGIGYAGVFLSHVMIVFLIIPLIISFSLFYFFIYPKPRRLFYAIVCQLLIGIGLSAFYLFPVIYYKPITVFKELYSELYLNHFTPLHRLFYSPWGYAAIGEPGEMSRQIGLINWSVVILGFTFIIFFVLTKKVKKIFFIVVLLINFVFLVFMMTKNSLFVWDLIEKLTLIDFPWRFLSIITFITSMIGAYIVSLINNKYIKITVFILLAYGILYTSRNYLRVNQYTDFPLWVYVSSEQSTNTDDEYLPLWVDRKIARKENTPLVDDTSVPIENIIRKSNMISFSYIAETETKINIQHMYFPGWQNYIDGKSNKITKDSYGRISVLLPQGAHTAEFRYIPTLIMRMGDLTTMITICTIIIISIRMKMKRLL